MRPDYNKDTVQQEQDFSSKQRQPQSRQGHAWQRLDCSSNIAQLHPPWAAAVPLQSWRPDLPAAACWFAPWFQRQQLRPVSWVVQQGWQTDWAAGSTSAGSGNSYRLQAGFGQCQAAGKEQQQQQARGNDRTDAEQGRSRRQNSKCRSGVAVHTAQGLC